MKKSFNQIWFIAFYLLLFTSCIQQKDNKEHVIIENQMTWAHFDSVWAYNNDIADIVFRFPIKSFPITIIKNTKYNRFRSYSLMGFREEQLWNRISDSSVIIRFLWERTFHPPFVFKLEKQHSGSLFTLKGTDSRAGGYYIGKLNTICFRQFPDSILSGFIDLLSEKGFWDMESFSETDDMIDDGSDWLLEVKEKGRYHLVHRSTPEAYSFRPNLKDELQRFEFLCRYIMNLSDIEQLKEPIY